MEFIEFLPIFISWGTDYTRTLLSNFSSLYITNELSKGPCKFLSIHLSRGPLQCFVYLEQEVGIPQQFLLNQGSVHTLPIIFLTRVLKIAASAQLCLLGNLSANFTFLILQRPILESEIYTYINPSGDKAQGILKESRWRWGSTANANAFTMKCQSFSMNSL